MMKYYKYLFFILLKLNFYSYSSDIDQSNPIVKASNLDKQIEYLQSIGSSYPNSEHLCNLRDEQLKYLHSLFDIEENLVNHKVTMALLTKG